MYNRYQGNSGKVKRIAEPVQPKKESKPQPKPIPSKPPPLKPLKSPGFSLESILPKGALDLETEDIILLLVLYLMYRKSGDTDLLIMMGAMFLL